MVADETPGGGRRAQYRTQTQNFGWTAARNGFTVPSWPKEYGGAGLNKDEVVVQQEMQRINAQPLVGMGLSMIGPALLETAPTHKRTPAKNCPR